MNKKIIIILFLIGAMISGCSNSSSSSSESLTEDDLADGLVEGAYAYVTYELSGMGTTKENLDSFIRFSEDDNRVREMLLNGEIIGVEKGTKVKVLERNLLEGWVKVQIESGDYQGVTAYSVYEHIGANPND